MCLLISSFFVIATVSWLQALRGAKLLSMVCAWALSVVVYLVPFHSFTHGLSCFGVRRCVGDMDWVLVAQLHIGVFIIEWYGLASFVMFLGYLPHASSGQNIYSSLLTMWPLVIRRCQVEVGYVSHYGRERRWRIFLSHEYRVIFSWSFWETGSHGVLQRPRFTCKVKLAS